MADDVYKLYIKAQHNWNIRVWKIYEEFIMRWRQAVDNCKHEHVEIEFATSDKEDTRVPYVMCKECGEQIRDKQLIKQILSVYS